MQNQKKFNEKYNLPKIPDSEFTKPSNYYFAKNENPGRVESLFLRFMHSIFTSPIILIAFVGALVIFLMSIIVPQVSNHHYDVVVNGDKTLLGTTNDGYDVWSRTWKGLSNTFLLSGSAAFGAVILGTIIGTYIGFNENSNIDKIVMKFTQIFNSLPAAIWYLFIIYLSNMSEVWFTIFLVLTIWVKVIEKIRTFFNKSLSEGYIRYTNIIGANKFTKFFKHLLPNYSILLFTLFIDLITRITIILITVSLLGFFAEDSIITISDLLQIVKLNLSTQSDQFNINSLLLPTILLGLSTTFLYIISTGLKVLYSDIILDKGDIKYEQIN